MSADIRFDLAKLRRLQRRRDVLRAQRDGVAEMLRDAVRVGRDARAQFGRQVEASMQLQRARGDQLVEADLSPEEALEMPASTLHAAGISVANLRSIFEAQEAAAAHAETLRTIDSELTPLTTVVRRCEQLVEGSTTA